MTSSAFPTAADPTAYQDHTRPRPTADKGHRLGHILEALATGLEELAGSLDTPPDGRVLDYGCADMPYRSHFAASVDYVGADLPGNPLATVDLGADGSLPADSGPFDTVVSTQVLEHVSDPRLYLSEAFRVLRPGGQMLLSTHGVMVYHPDPVDYWRWTCAGLERAVVGAGFVVERFEGIVGIAAMGLQIVQDSAHDRLPRRFRRPFVISMQRLVALADRVQSPASKRLNACVFATVARKP